MSMQCQQNVHKMSTKCPQNVHKMSTKCPQNDNKMSTKCQQNVNKMLTKCQQNVNKMSTKCQQNVNKISTKCQQNVNKISTKYQQNINRMLRHFVFVANFSKRVCWFLAFGKFLWLSCMLRAWHLQQLVTIRYCFLFFRRLCSDICNAIWCFSTKRFDAFSETEINFNNNSVVEKIKTSLFSVSWMHCDALFLLSALVLLLILF